MVSVTVCLFEMLIITSITVDIDTKRVAKEREGRIKSSVLDLSKEGKK